MGENISAYSAWFASWPYRFYPILAVILVYLVAATHRHYGLMLKAEYRTRKEGKVLRDGAQPMMTTEVDVGMSIRGKESVWVFILPVLALVLMTSSACGSLEVEVLPMQREDSRRFCRMQTRRGPSYGGSFSMVIVAMALVLAMKRMTLEDVEHTLVTGMKQMHFAMMILILSWSIKSACDAVGTADYIVGVASNVLSPGLIPFVVFVVVAFISFTTGTSWGTFSIMMPIAVPLSYQLSGSFGRLFTPALPQSLQGEYLATTAPPSVTQPS